jgi:hypothetical protein
LFGAKLAHQFPLLLSLKKAQGKKTLWRSLSVVKLRHSPQAFELCRFVLDAPRILGKRLVRFHKMRLPELPLCLSGLRVIPKLVEIQKRLIVLRHIREFSPSQPVESKATNSHVRRLTKMSIARGWIERMIAFDDANLVILLAPVIQLDT